MNLHYRTDKFTTQNCTIWESSEIKTDPYEALADYVRKGRQVNLLSLRLNAANFALSWIW
jgi:hypothetical protein